MVEPDVRRRGPVDAAALTGQLVDGRYLVGEKIARGGMATVYQATDTRLDRAVALKVMHAALGGDEQFVSRFVREARSAARLSHPNVVAVHDQGEDGGLVYLVMEHLPGHTLRDVVRDQAPLPPARALRLVEPMLAALAAAHRAGIVHRDVKPENVLISDDGVDAGAGRIKVADFGLAKAVSAETQHTATGGVLIGTVSYLAPELLTEGRSDTRADVYAAGVVLHELLTGVKPHRGDTPIQIAYHHVHTDVPLPSVSVPGIPAYVDALVARACVRDPGQRPADAGVLLRHAHRVLQALDAGVVDDPDLVADLRPGPSPAPVGSVLPDEAGPIGFDGPDPAAGTWVFDPHDDRPSWPPAETPRRPEPPVAMSRPDATRERTPSAPARRGRGPWVVLALVLVLVLVAAAAWWLGVARYTQAPGVIGLSQDQAVARVEAAGLSAEIADPQYSESVPAGEVLTADPSGGDRILDGDAVTLVLSLGPERYDVPRVRGRSEDQAQDAVLAANLEVGDRIERYSAEMPPGEVLGAQPRTGTTLRPDTEVSLVVSLGPRPIEVEDLTGTDADEAEQQLTDAGLVVERTDEFSEDTDEGDVIAQDPDSGELFPGDTIELTVSSGPEEVEIPSGLVGSTVEDARGVLEDLGFVVVEEDEGSLGLGFVTEVDPGEGESAPAGSEVTIQVI